MRKHSGKFFRFIEGLMYGEIRTHERKARGPEHTEIQSIQQRKLMWRKRGGEIQDPKIMT